MKISSIINHYVDDCKDYFFQLNPTTEIDFIALSILDNNSSSLTIYYKVSNTDSSSLKVPIVYATGLMICDHAKNECVNIPIAKSPRQYDNSDYDYKLILESIFNDFYVKNSDKTIDFFKEIINKNPEERKKEAFQELFTKPSTNTTEKEKESPDWVNEMIDSISKEIEDAMDTDKGDDEK